MDTKEQILEAAIAVFSEKGYHKASMDQVAAEAKVSKGAIYYFFKNKNELFLEIITSGFYLLNEELSKIVDSDLDVPQAIYRTVSAYVNLCLDYPRLAMIILSESTDNLDPDLSDSINQLLGQIVDQIISLLDEAEKYMAMRPCRKEILAVSFLGMLSGICIRQIRFEYPYERRDIIDELSDTLLHGILQGSL